MDHHFTLHPELWQGQLQIVDVKKNYDFGKGYKSKCVTTKRLVTKPPPNQPNTMENEIYMPRGYNDKHVDEFGNIGEIECACFEAS